MFSLLLLPAQEKFGETEESARQKFEEAKRSVEEERRRTDEPDEPDESEKYVTCSALASSVDILK